MSFAGYPNRSDKRDPAQRAVAIPALGWRLWVESFPIGPFASSLFSEDITGLNGQSPLAANSRHVRDFSLKTLTLNTRPFRFP